MVVITIIVLSTLAAAAAAVVTVAAVSVSAAVSVKKCGKSPNQKHQSSSRFSRPASPSTERNEVNIPLVPSNTSPTLQHLDHSSNSLNDTRSRGNSMDDPSVSPRIRNHSTYPIEQGVQCSQLPDDNVRRLLSNRVVNGGQKQATAQTLHCMIIGSHGDSPPPEAVAKNKSKSLYLRGVGKDLEKMQTLINGDARKKISGVSRVFYCDQKKLTPFKEDIKRHMQDTKLNHPLDTSNGLLIWYTGHGKAKSGDWPMKDGYLTFRDIYDLYMQNFKQRPLYIVTDCCYSGAWVQECAKLMDEDGMSCGHQAKKNDVLIKVFAACLPNEAAFDKYYVNYSGARLHTWEHSSKSLCFAEHRRLGDNSCGCQHTLGVDFTHANSCVLDLNGECIRRSTWAEYVDELIEEPYSRNYLV